MITTDLCCACSSPVQVDDKYCANCGHESVVKIRPRHELLKYQAEPEVTEAELAAFGSGRLRSKLSAPKSGMSDDLKSVIREATHQGGRNNSAKHHDRENNSDDLDNLLSELTHSNDKKGQRIWVHKEENDNVPAIKEAKVARENQANSSQKTKKNTILMGLLLGAFGGHKFYLGSWGWGIVYFVMCATYIPLIVALIETVRIALMSDEDFYLKLEQFQSKQPKPFGFFW